MLLVWSRSPGNQLLLACPPRDIALTFKHLILHTFIWDTCSIHHKSPQNKVTSSPLFPFIHLLLKTCFACFLFKKKNILMTLIFPRCVFNYCTRQFMLFIEAFVSLFTWCCEQLVCFFFLNRVPFYKNRNKKNISRDRSFWGFGTYFRIGLVSSLWKIYSGIKRWQMLDWPWHGASINRVSFQTYWSQVSKMMRRKEKKSRTTFEEMIALFDGGNNYFLWWLKLQLISCPERRCFRTATCC